MRVFVSGPYGDSNPKDVIARNVRVASAVGRNLMVAGHEVYVPHTMSWGWEEDKRLTEEQYKGMDMGFLGYWAEAIIRIPGKSGGADAEMEYAKRLGLTIMTYHHDLSDGHGL